jgi:hypothetical protein
MMPPTFLRSVFLPLLALGLVAGLAACQSKESMPAEAAKAEAPAAPVVPAPAPDKSAPAPADSGVGPISSRGTSPEAAAPPVAPSGPAAGDSKLSFDLPKDWKPEPPRNNMRLAQATIPGPGGAGDFVLFYFGAGGGGGVDANLERWTDQMEAGPGTPKPERGTLTANGLKVSWLDLHGTLKPSGMGMGPSSPVPDARLFGAIVEGPGGPWFFKATGPDKTLGSQREAFFQMLKTARPAPNA